MKRACLLGCLFVEFFGIRVTFPLNHIQSTCSILSLLRHPFDVDSDTI